MVRDDNFIHERKEYAIADVLLDINIDTDILSEIAITKELSEVYNSIGEYGTHREPKIQILACRSVGTFTHFFILNKLAT